MLGLSRMSADAAMSTIGSCAAKAVQFLLAFDNSTGQVTRVTVINGTALPVAYWIRGPVSILTLVVVPGQTTATRLLPVGDRPIREDRSNGKKFRGVPFGTAYPWST